MKKFLVGYKTTRKELVWSIPLILFFREIIMFGIREALITSEIFEILTWKYYVLETIFFMIIMIFMLSLAKGRYWGVSDEKIYYVGPTSIFNDLKELYYFIFKKREFKSNWKININNIEMIEIDAQKRLLAFGTIGYPIFIKLILNDKTTTKYWVIENNQLVEIMNYLESKDILIIDNYKILNALSDKNVDLHKHLTKVLKEKRLII